MLIGLMSDSHDNLPAIAAAVAFFNRNKVGLVLHAGDIISPFCARELKKLACPLVIVFGNNDGERAGWRKVAVGWAEIHEHRYETTIDGCRILMMHEPLDLSALEAGGLYDVIIYGHTHEVVTRTAGKTLVVNPGECGAWLSGKSTVALLYLPERNVRIEQLLP